MAPDNGTADEGGGGRRKQHRTDHRGDRPGEEAMGRIAKLDLVGLEADPFAAQTAGKIPPRAEEIIAITMKNSPVPISKVVDETPTAPRRNYRESHSCPEGQKQQGQRQRCRGTRQDGRPAHSRVQRLRRSRFNKSRALYHRIPSGRRLSAMRQELFGSTPNELMSR